MELYDVVEAINSNLKTEEGTLVLLKSMSVHPKFRVYKVFHHDLYLVKGGERKILHSTTNAENTSITDINSAWKKYDRTYLDELMKLIMEGTLKTLISNGVK